MKRKLATVIATLGLLSLFAVAPVQASVGVTYPAGSNCSVYVIFYGNDNYVPNGTKEFDFCWTVGRQVGTSSIHDSIDSNCQGLFGVDNGTWDNCISSIGRTSGFPSYARLCLYTRNPPLTIGGYYTYNPNSSPIPDLNPIGFDDTISYLKYIDSRTTDCSIHA